VRTAASSPDLSTAWPAFSALLDPDYDVAFTNWVDGQPCQLMLLAPPIHWTAKVEELLVVGATTETVARNYFDTLELLAKKVLEDIFQNLLTKVAQLITEMVHQRDVSPRGGGQDNQRGERLRVRHAPASAIAAVLGHQNREDGHEPHVLRRDHERESLQLQHGGEPVRDAANGPLLPDDDADTAHKDGRQPVRARAWMNREYRVREGAQLYLGALSWCFILVLYLGALLRRNF